MYCRIKRASLKSAYWKVKELLQNKVAALKRAVHGQYNELLVIKCVNNEKLRKELFTVTTTGYITEAR